MQVAMRLSLTAALIGSVLALSGQSFPSVRWQAYATGLQSPVDIQHAGDGSGRLFVVEQRGRIRLIKNGTLQATPVLDIISRVMFGGEMGLLGLAFPPGFREKQYFYVNYIDRQRRTSISRFRIQGDIADPASEEVLLTIQQPYENHNGGQIVFGPRDGLLYIGMGDGGSGGDPQKFAQNPNSLLGKMLRMDVENGSREPRIWASGLRNPWRFSFDRETGDLYIADVGQGDREEIDFQPASSTGGENYGWSLMEGNLCFDDRNCASRTDVVRPIYDYPRSDGGSVTGGFVYRGQQYPALQGLYLFGDYVSRQIFALRRNGSTWQVNKYGDGGFAVSSFGEDESGEIFAADHNGRIMRLASDAPAFSVTAAVNAASFSGPVAAGGIGTLFTIPLPGVNGIVAAAGYPLPQSLSGVTVRVNGTPVPLFAVANAAGRGQVNFQVPWDLAGDAVITVSAGGSATPDFRVNIQPAAPGLFLLEGIAAAQQGTDYSIVTPANPVPRGGVAVLYATGLGAVSNRPALGSAALSAPLSSASSTVGVSIGGRPATVLFAGLAPGFAGLYQLNVIVPADAPAGSVDVVVTAGGVAGPAARLPIR